MLVVLGIDQTSKAYELFGDGGTSEVFSREESWEVQTAQSMRLHAMTLLEEIGVRTNTFQMYDGATETNINYNGPNGEPIGFEFRHKWEQRI